MLVWNFTASALRFAVTSLTANTNLVTKVYFPREIFPFAAVAVSLVDFAVAATVLVGDDGLLRHHAVAAHCCLLPVVVVVHAMFTAALALLLSMANLFYRDVKYLFDVDPDGLDVRQRRRLSRRRRRRLGRRAHSRQPDDGIVEAYRSVLLYGTRARSAGVRMRPPRSAVVLLPCGVAAVSPVRVPVRREHLNADAARVFDGSGSSSAAASGTTRFAI